MNETGPLILVIDDESAMRRFLRVSLESHGYRWAEADNGREGLAQAAQRNPELVLLDLGLPDQDGLEVTVRLREWAKMPIIVISARGQEEDKVRALDAGADDYLTKPFGVNELLARIRVALRHAHGTTAASAPLIEVGALKLDLERREVFVGGREIHLTPIEYKLLTLLAKHAGKVLTQRQLLNEVWGYQNYPSTRTVDNHILKLRQKLEKDPSSPVHFRTVHGMGYKFVR